jgi:hypothetical protein
MGVFSSSNYSREEQGMALEFKSLFGFNYCSRVIKRWKKMALRVKFGNLVRKRPVVVKREVNIISQFLRGFGIRLDIKRECGQQLKKRHSSTKIRSAQAEFLAPCLF